MEGLVVFVIGRQQYAVATSEVLEVARMVLLSTGPEDTTSVLAGDVTFRGRVLPVLDLHAVLRQPATAELLRQAIVFVRVAGAECGLIADDVLDVLPPLDDDDAAVAPARPPVALSIALGTRMILRLDSEWIAAQCRRAGATAGGRA